MSQPIQLPDSVTNPSNTVPNMSSSSLPLSNPEVGNRSHGQSESFSGVESEDCSHDQSEPPCDAQSEDSSHGESKSSSDAVVTNHSHGKSDSFSDLQSDDPSMTLWNVIPFSEDYATFEPFPRLPVELRFQIWQLARPGPRVVEPNEGDRRVLCHTYQIHHARSSYDKTYLNPFQDWVTSAGYWSRQPPSILHTNQESRSVGLRFYELVPLDLLMESQNQDKNRWHKETPPSIYFNFDLDILYISRATFRLSQLEGSRYNPFIYGFTMNPTWKRVKHLAIDLIQAASLPSQRYSYDPEPLRYRDILQKFSFLKTFTFVRDWSLWNIESYPRCCDDHDWPRWWTPSRLLRCLKSHDFSVLGLSFEEICRSEKEIMEDWDEQQRQATLPFLDARHPVLQHRAYFGDGKFILPHGDYLWDYEEGPRQETFLKGSEVKLLPRDVKRALGKLRGHEIRSLSENNGS